MSKKSWADLTPTQRRLVVAGGIVQVGLQAAALRDLKRRPVDQVRGRRRWWVCASFVNTVGPLAYFIFGRRRHP
ncbi:MAG: PLDc N-terminal domain-containing protein [Knoellia sp.]